MIIKLLKFEFWRLILKRNICAYSFISIMVGLLSFSLMNEIKYIESIVPSLVILWPAIYSISYSTLFFKEDLKDGNLEFLLSSHSALEITIVKFITLLSILSFSYILAIGVYIITFNFNINLTIILFCTSLLTATYISGLVILTSAIDVFFEDNSNLLTVIILPFMIPIFILDGLIIADAKISYFNILIGLNLIIVPIILGLCSYLIKETYN